MVKQVPFSELIGKKVVAFRGMTHKKSDYSKEKSTPLQYILFDDGKTYIELSEQDYYDFHDCAQSARHIFVLQDERFWNMLMNKENSFNEPGPGSIGHNPF